MASHKPTKQDSQVEIIKGKEMQTGLVIHIPHVSAIILQEYGQGILLSEKELQEEIIWSMDAYCDELLGAGFGVPVKP